MRTILRRRQARPHPALQSETAAPGPVNPYRRLLLVEPAAQEQQPVSRWSLMSGIGAASASRRSRFEKSMIIGADYLGRFRLLIDFPTRRVWLR